VKGFGLVFAALVWGPLQRRPVRVLLPVVGVAIGVAAVAAIHYANRSVTESFRESASAFAGKSDFVVTGISGVPVSKLADLAFLWRIGSFAPAVTGTAVLAGGGREVVSILGVDWGGDSAVREVRLVAPEPGRGRSRLLTRGAVLVSEPFAKRHGLDIGSRLGVTVGGKPRDVEVAGIVALEGVARASGGDVLLTDIFTAQDLLGKAGLVDRVDIVLDASVDRAAAGAEIARRLPKGLVLEPPTRAAATADRMVRAFRFNLNALGSLTILTGLFLIANAVSIAVLRRRPEIATLRALGVSRAAVFGAFLVEGLIVGALGTLLGEVLGLWVSRAALSAVGGTVSTIYLPTTRIGGTRYTGAVVLSAIVGMAASLVATLVPALQATRVPPSPAMRPGSIEGVARKRLWPRAIGAGLALVLAALAARAEAVDGFPLFGFAAVALVVLALALAAPALVKIAAAVLGGPIARIRPVEGGLGAGFFGGALTRNGIAVAALAMALGMTLAMIVTVASIRETVRVWVESTLRSDLWIKADAGRGSGLVGDLPEDVIAFVRDFEGVAAVDPFRARDATDAKGRPYTLAAGDFRVLARAGGLPMLDGTDPRPLALAAREHGDVLVSEPYARRFSVRRGSTVLLPTPQGPRQFTVAGVYRDYSNDRGTVVMDRDLYLALYPDRRVTSLAAIAKPGVDAADLRRRILAAAQGRYSLSISTNRDLRREALRIFDRTFAVTRALEAIAIAVAVLGIANALLASAVERRRAFGLLKAIGASGGQIRRATLVEAFLTGATGVLAALAAGGAFAWLLLAIINPQSFGWTVAPSVPVAALAGAAGLVLAAACAAGILPGRIAAAVDPAAACAEE